MGLLDLLFPKKCVGCGKNGTYFCVSCIGESKLFFPQVCAVCERPALDGLTHKHCRNRLTPDGLISIWEYTGVPRRLIQKLKYKFVFDVALSLASPTAGILKSVQRNTPETPIWGQEKWVIVPIPLHWKRENWRGFNQSEETAKMLAKLMNWKIAPILVRTKSAKQQVGLTANNRRKNVAGIFSVNIKALDTRGTLDTRAPLILMDDVWTTGATMLEAVKILKIAGFKKVWCLALAR